ncbi:MAG: DUF2845 domain-containing protein [Desulfuromonadaceae bacterium]|nr:DUF2845 domain-containing protein [Desulfuromonadaceae bacterium]
MKRLFVMCTVAILFSALQASADNFRCPNGNIVSTGDSISTVAVKCDPPAGLFKREEPLEISSDGMRGTKTVYIEVQEWTYTQGSGLLHTLIFRNGVLSEVRTGGFVQ